MQPQEPHQSRIARWANGVRRIAKDRATWAIIGICSLIIIAAAAFNLYSSSQRDKQAKEIIKTVSSTSATSTTPPAGAASPEPTDSVPTTFADLSSTNFKKPTCKRLENRPAIHITSDSCQYTLRAFGSVDMAVVLLYGDSGAIANKDALTNSDANSTASLNYINTYLAQQAQRYAVTNPLKINITYYGPYQTDPAAPDTYYRDNMMTLLNYFQKTSADNNVPEDQYDLVEYFLLDNVYGGAAFPMMHRAFTENALGVPTFVHESLHLFEASDKYNNNDCNTIGTGDPFGRYSGTQPGRDIMCSNFSLNTSNINDITAREIGWAN